MRRWRCIGIEGARLLLCCIRSLPAKSIRIVHDGERKSLSAWPLPSRTEGVQCSAEVERQQRAAASVRWETNATRVQRNECGGRVTAGASLVTK